ncbi:hypothetical protein OSTOST_23485 [Ostertagia ostertagi]
MKASFQRTSPFWPTFIKSQNRTGTLETDMGITLDEIHDEMKAAEELDASWTHYLLSTTCANISGDELLRRTTRFLETATTSREKLLRLTQRYLLFDSTFLALVKGDQLPASRREQWEKQKHRGNFKAQDVDKQIAKLERVIDEINYEVLQAEKLQKKEKNAHQGKKIHTRSFSVQVRQQSFTATTQTDGIEVHSLGVQALLQKTSDEVTQGQEEHWQSPGHKRRCSESSEEKAAKVKVISDEEYLIQLIHESADREDEEDDDDDQMSREKEIPKTYQRTHNRRQRPNLARSAEPENIHFSDSCPKVVNGNDRFRLADRNGTCFLCLGSCPRSGCLEDYKECWYCFIVRTRAPILRFLIPKDKGHHRALCTIPDSKDRIRRAIREVQQEIEEAERH